MANLRVGRRSGLVFRGGRNRRDTIWGGIQIVTTVLGSGAVIIRSLGASFLALRPFTVVRERVELYVVSDQEAASELQLAAYGTCVVTEQAAAIGVTAVPTPTTDLDSDAWFVHQVLLSAHGAGTVDSQRGTRYQVDSKAMRKVEDGFNLIDVLEVVSAQPGVTVSSGGRFLVKLH